MRHPLDVDPDLVKRCGSERIGILIYSAESKNGYCLYKDLTDHRPNIFKDTKP